MQTKSRFFDDLARMANGAAGTVSGLRAEAGSVARHRLERLLAEMNLVTREEFEVTHAMLVQARLEQDALRQRLEVLEAHLAATSPASAANKKPAANKKTAAKAKSPRRGKSKKPG